jgi:two-component system sensor kinase FixL
MTPDPPAPDGGATPAPGHVAAGELHDSLYRAVAETVVDGLVVIDEHGAIEWMNQAASAMFGYAVAAIRGQNVKLLMPAPFHDEHDGYLRRYLATGERRIIGIGREVRGRRADGSEFPLSLAVGETVIGGARKFTGILRDLSVQKHMEALLQERQTLARVGELAAVVAHEVRNPLAAIKGVVEVIQTRFPADSPDRKILGDLLTRVDSLDHLVSDLLVYARPAPPAFKTVPFLSLVRETAAVAAGDPLAARVRFEVDGPETNLWVDPGQMGRALLNLMTNAAQAMRQGGVVRVVGELSPSRYRLSLIDEGPGMDAALVARCQEPFFTTKTRGTGLGLPIARRVVEEHHGTFRVTSTPGQGTTVVIELPAPAA